jgi:hypothetical protein
MSCTTEVAADGCSQKSRFAADTCAGGGHERLHYSENKALWYGRRNKLVALKLVWEGTARQCMPDLRVLLVAASNSACCANCRLKVERKTKFVYLRKLLVIHHACCW